MWRWRLTALQRKPRMPMVNWSCFSAPLTTRSLIHHDHAACPVWDKRSVTVAAFSDFLNQTCSENYRECHPDPEPPRSGPWVTPYYFDKED
jgi:hypothetical protein